LLRRQPVVRRPGRFRRGPPLGRPPFAPPPAPAGPQPGRREPFRHRRACFRTTLTGPIMRTRVYIAGVLALMINAVLFGIGAVGVRSLPPRTAEARCYLPLSTALSGLWRPPIAWAMAPRLRARHWRRAEIERRPFARREFPRRELDR